jgi:hypothetical protein
MLSEVYGSSVFDTSAPSSFDPIALWTCACSLLFGTNDSNCVENTSKVSWPVIVIATTRTKRETEKEREVKGECKREIVKKKEKDKDKEN